MKLRFLLVVLPALVFLSACADIDPHASRSGATTQTFHAVCDLSEREITILETALREWVKNTPDGRSDRAATTFIAIGYDGAAWQDPPSALLHRLRDLRKKVKPPSAARMPLPNEKYASGAYRGVEDPDAPGKRCYIHSAELIEWISETEVRVKVTSYSGPLAAIGGSYVLALREERWIFVSGGMGWIS